MSEILRFANPCINRKQTGNLRRCNRWRRKNREKYRAYMREYMKRKRDTARVLT